MKKCCSLFTPLYIITSIFTKYRIQILFQRGLLAAQKLPLPTRATRNEAKNKRPSGLGFRI